MTNKEAADILRMLLKRYASVPIPRGTSKSIFTTVPLMIIMALNKAIELLEKEPNQRKEVIFVGLQTPKINNPFE